MAVGFCVKNVGPGRVDFRVPWFESRVRNQGTLLATNGFSLVQAQLSPGASTTRQQWLEDVARTRSLHSTSGPTSLITKGPTTEEQLRREAKVAFVEFCQSSTATVERASHRMRRANVPKEFDIEPCRSSVILIVKRRPQVVRP